MAALNPFNVGVHEIRHLTPRRTRYIQERNAAQDQRFDNVAESIRRYSAIIEETRARYTVAGLEDQVLIKPYLTILYFELGQLFEVQEQPKEALRYYEQAGIHGHLVSIESAKRLGSKVQFVSVENTHSSKLDNRGDFFIDKLAILGTLHKNIVLIKSDDQKGSGVLAKHETFGNILITVDHVALPDAIAYVGGQEIPLDSLEAYNSGPNILFILGALVEVHSKDTHAILTKEQLKIGEKVYFGGYPFKKTDAHFHTGRVSSIGRNGEISIDGVAVPGMSGGPIAIEREGKLYIVGAIASETFDPIEGFAKALDEMHVDQADMQAQRDWANEIKNSLLKKSQRHPQFTKIPKGKLYISKLSTELDKDPAFFDKIWDDLNKKGIISDDGDVEPTKIIPGQLGLREQFRQYERDVIGLLQARTKIKPMDLSRISLSSEYRNPTSSVNTVALSLVQSLSTGLITGYLFQEFREIALSLQDKEPTEFAIGRKNRLEKNKKRVEREARKVRAEAIQTGNFENNGIPRTLYRFVSDQDAKDIRKNGIVHLGGNLDEIPFITQPEKHMAQSVGAVSTEKMVVVYTDRILGLSRENVRTVPERGGVVTYRINISIPREAIEILEA